MIIIIETKSLLTVAENNGIRTNYIKAKIDNTQIRKCSLCGDLDETVHHITSKCN